MKIDGITTAAPPQTEGAPNPRNTREAAERFEALMIGQLIKSARGGGGWLDSGEDQAGSTMMEVAEENLAQVLASQGGMGLANMVVQGLERANDQSSQSGRLPANH
jgi:Rod binding domain-containing protein